MSAVSVPDTVIDDIITTIGNFAGSAMLVLTSFIVGLWAIKSLLELVGFEISLTEKSKTIIKSKLGLSDSDNGSWRDYLNVTYKKENHTPNFVETYGLVDTDKLLAVKNWTVKTF